MDHQSYSFRVILGLPDDGIRFPHEDMATGYALTKGKNGKVPFFGVKKMKGEHPTHIFSAREGLKPINPAALHKKEKTRT